MRRLRDRNRLRRGEAVRDPSSPRDARVVRMTGRRVARFGQDDRRGRSRCKRGRLPKQPPSSLSSLSEITESREPAPGEEAVRRQPVHLLPRLHLPLTLRLQPPLTGGDDGGALRDVPTSSSTRLPLRDPQPPSHRWPPALRGLLPPGPALLLPLISGPPHRRAPLPDQPGSPR